VQRGTPFDGTLAQRTQPKWNASELEKRPRTWGGAGTRHRREQRSCCTKGLSNVAAPATVSFSSPTVRGT
jgi:hypothetical protein